MTYLADNVKSGASVTTKVRAGGDRAMGHDWSGNVGLDEHAIRQGGVGGLILLGGQGVQDGSINSQRAHRGPSGGNGGWRGSRVNTSSGIGILIAFCRDTGEERAPRSVIGVAVSARRAVPTGRLSGRRSALRAGPSASRNFGMNEAAPFAVGTRSGDPEGL